MCRRVFGNVFKLIGHNLESTEYSTEFRIICSKVPFTLSTPQSLLQMVIALFCVNLRNIRAMLHQKMTQSGKHGSFRGIFSSLNTDSKLFQMVKIYPSMCWKMFGNIFKLIGCNLEKVEDENIADLSPYDKYKQISS